MKIFREWALLSAALVTLTPLVLSQTPPPAAAPHRTPSGKSSVAIPLTNNDVIRLIRAKFSDEIIESKIRSSKTRFDTSVDGLISLREAGVSDRLLAVMINPAAPAVPAPGARTTSTPPAAAPPAAALPASTPPPSAAPESQPGSRPSNTSRDPAPAASTPPKAGITPTDPAQAPQTFGIYLQENGELKPLGHIQTKVLLSRFHTINKLPAPLLREKVDITIPGAHSAIRHEMPRPAFYAYFPASRDVSKFRLLQAKITGQKLDQRTIANASILFSAELNQDEVPCDISPTSVKDLYRITLREDLPSGEFGFVEGDTAPKSTSDPATIDVWDFAVNTKEDKQPLTDYLAMLPAENLPDTAFLEWTKDDCQKVIDDREGKVIASGSTIGIFKRPPGGLEVYWADGPFAKAFARLEMLDKQLTPEQTLKLAALLMAQDDSQFHVLISMSTKIGSGKLAGADEADRIMRPFDATMTNDKGKDVVPASRLEFVGGYAGLWKATFDQKSIRGALMTPEGGELDFEARLNQNLDFKAKFLTTLVNAKR